MMTRRGRNMFRIVRNKVTKFQLLLQINLEECDNITKQDAPHKDKIITFLYSGNNILFIEDSVVVWSPQCSCYL
jgi:hypothetical protein